MPSSEEPLGFGEGIRKRYQGTKIVEVKVIKGEKVGFNGRNPPLPPWGLGIGQKSKPIIHARSTFAVYAHSKK